MPVLLGLVITLTGCGSYREFTLPVLPGSARELTIQWRPRPGPLLTRGPAGSWDSDDVLNPSVARTATGYVNLYSGYDGKTWRTGVATSLDGLAWTKQTQILAPDPATWEHGAIAANGSVIDRHGLAYYYQAGDPPRVGLARRRSTWEKQGRPVLDLGPYGSWDERGVADPYVIEAGGKLYLFYLGMDRARRQRLGVAESQDGIQWTKLRSNPVLELGAFGAFDESGLGEPAVWASNGFYWMLYTGRDRNENRKLGLARSRDGVHWEKLPQVFAGSEPWDSKVICDPAVLVDGDQVRVWFGGGDVARPDQEIHGQIGYGVLTIR